MRQVDQTSGPAGRVIDIHCLSSIGMSPHKSAAARWIWQAIIGRQSTMYRPREAWRRSVAHRMAARLDKGF
jgi:hypothetical protein